MTNDSRARLLLWFVRDVRDECRRAAACGNWNLALRRAQEVLETGLKAMLLHFGVDYPHEHHVAPALCRVVAERGAEHDPERMERIRRVSADLARKRGPAGYVEILCTEDEARAALEGAEEAFRLAEEHVGPLPDGPFSPGS